MSGPRPESLMSGKYRSIARELAGRLPQTHKGPLRQPVYR